MNTRAPIAIHEVTTSADLERLLDLPYRLYATDPRWVPPFLQGHHPTWYQDLIENAGWTTYRRSRLYERQV